MNLNFKDRLTLKESIEMINEVCNSVFLAKSESVSAAYLPELYDFSFRLSIAKHYGGYESSGDAEEDYAVAMSIDTQKLDVDMLQLEGIKTAIREKINFRKDAINKSNIRVVSGFDALVSPIENLIHTISDKLSSINMEQMNEMLNGVDVKELMKQYKKD